ncbi:CAP-Gly domain-containing linker protein 1-like isoform X3 [Liolophura sinensis]|uniref:CAP-Gly domain-containing linker protein 1-like isoform X3 n=1 Tax=Liolophura sinensis TaxID=3198878 RepID=UPI0031590A9E
MSLPKPTGLKAPSKISKSATGLTQGSSGIPAPGANRGQSPEPQPFQQPVDDFIIGNRVWVGGTKPGYIAFLGETQFAPGEWAGVVLDEAVGKNDGSVSGVRYFQCEPKRGVFARISKLSRTEGGVSAPTPRPEGQSNGTKTPPSNLAPRSVTPKLGLSVSRTSSGSTSSLNKGVSGSASTNMGSGSRSGFKTGDRVMVSGTKPGTLRYVGETDFAKGIWAGVELDDPMGKNDGAVAGKRYFSCQPLYGLFAPVHKVARLGSSATAVGMTTPRSSKLPSSNSALRASRERSGSQDSISSISSSASSVSRSRVRLGIGSLNNQVKPGQSRPSSLNLTANTSALQKALKEKEEHIEQLLRERDLERSEVARAAAQVDEAEGQLANTRSEYDRFREDTEESIKKLKTRLAELEKEKVELTGRLEDEKRKTEDLQFQIEEESICKDDLEVSQSIKTEEDEAKVKELELQVKLERERADKLEEEMKKMKSVLEAAQSQSKSSDDLHTMYLDQIEELTHKLSQAENKIKAFESGKQDDVAKTSQLNAQLTERSSRLAEVETALDTKKRDMKQLESRLAELEDEVKAGNTKQQKLQATIDDLTAKISSKDAASSSMNSEIQQLKNRFEDSQRQLEASKAKSEHLADDKLKLEQQIGDLMQNSGDSASQLSILNEQLRDKDRKIEEQQADLSSFTQKIAERETALETLKQDHLQGVEELVSKHKEELKSLQENRDDVQAEVEKLQTKIKTLLEQHEQEKTELENTRQREVTELKQTLQTVQEEQKKLEEIITQNKENMEKISTDNENIKFEKEKLERSVKKLEGEKEGLSCEVSKIQAELEQVKAEHGQLDSQHGSVQAQLTALTTEKEKLRQEKDQAEKKLQEAQLDTNKLTDRLDKLTAENMELTSNLEKQTAELRELEEQIKKLREENEEQKKLIETQQVEGKLSSELESQLAEIKKALQEAQAKLVSSEQEKEGLKQQTSEAIQQVNKAKAQFEGEKAQLETAMKQISQRLSDVSSESESKQASLKDSLDNTHSLLGQKEQELTTQRSQIEALEQEKTTLLAYKNSSQQLQLEVSELEKKVANLQSSLEESKANANFINNPDGEGNPALAKLKSDKDTLEGQVEFLNSVIVELQNKNEMLSVRLSAMEAGDHVNGALEASLESPSKVKAPRLFCDICDVFDKHETEDCPLQAMSDTESPPPSQHHGSRNEERPYCDICEGKRKGSRRAVCPHISGKVRPRAKSPPTPSVEKCKDDITDLINSTLGDIFEKGSASPLHDDTWFENKGRENENENDLRAAAQTESESLGGQDRSLRMEPTGDRIQFIKDHNGAPKINIQYSSPDNFSLDKLDTEIMTDSDYVSCQGSLLSLTPSEKLDPEKLEARTGKGKKSPKTPERECVIS